MSDRETPAIDDVESHAAEVQRIVRTGTIWTAVAVLGPGLILGPMLAAGWRPMDLPLAAGVAWWVGAVAAAFGLALLVWAGCPALGFPLEEAYLQKVFSIRVGIVVNLSGMALSGLAILLAPVGG